RSMLLRSLQTLRALPAIEPVRVGVLRDQALEHLALQPEAERVGRGVALAAAPPALGGIHGGEHGPAEVGGALVGPAGGCAHDPTTRTAANRPGPGGRW